MGRRRRGFSMEYTECIRPATRDASRLRFDSCFSWFSPERRPVLSFPRNSSITLSLCVLSISPMENPKNSIQSKRSKVRLGRGAQPYITAELYGLNLFPSAELGINTCITLQRLYRIHLSQAGIAIYQYSVEKFMTGPERTSPAWRRPDVNKRHAHKQESGAMRLTTNTLQRRLIRHTPSFYIIVSVTLQDEAKSLFFPSLHSCAFLIYFKLKNLRLLLFSSILTRHNTI